MSSLHICLIGLFYYIIIYLISKFASRKSDENEYIKTNAPAWLVTLGIVGDSISGVTYLSVPGSVEQKSFSYLAICMGYLLGYAIIAGFFLPLYHKRNLSSVYEWVGGELGIEAQKISSVLFVLSRVFGAAARLCLTAGVMHLFVFKNYNFGSSFSIIAVTLGISIYTLRSGIKSLIVTDTVQSAFLVLGVLAATYGLWHFLNEKSVEIIFYRPIVTGEGLDAWGSFLKSFFSGTLITLSMTGLDQNIMQKTFSVSNLKDLQKNFIRLGFIVLIVNWIVLIQGSLLSQSLPYFPELQSVPADQKLIQLVLQNQGLIVQILFLMGLSAATLNSADSVITTVTSSVKLDLLKNSKLKLIQIHWIVTGLLAFTTLMINYFSTGSAIDLVLKSAGWTYGPLLGYFTVAAFKFKNSPASLRIALVLSFLTTLLIHQYYQLGAEVIIVICILLLIYNAFIHRLKILRT